jgi:hypothetical protein
VTISKPSSDVSEVSSFGVCGRSNYVFALKRRHRIARAVYVFHSGVLALLAFKDYLPRFLFETEKYRRL